MKMPRSRLSTLGLVAILLMGWYCLSSGIALFWVTYTSFKSNAEFFSSTWTLPETLRFENYTYAWANAEIGHYFFNTAYITVLSTVGTVILWNGVSRGARQPDDSFSSHSRQSRTFGSR